MLIFFRKRGVGKNKFFTATLTLFAVRLKKCCSVFTAHLKKCNLSKFKGEFLKGAVQSGTENMSTNVAAPALEQWQC